MTVPGPLQPGLSDVAAAFPMTRWAWLRTYVRNELQKRPNAVAVTLPTTILSAEERDVLRWILRLPDIPASQLRIVLLKLDSALMERTDAGMPTRELLAALDGELADVPGQRRSALQAQADVWTSAASHPVIQREPRLLRWLEAERDRGSLPAEPQQRSALLSAALTVLDRLPGPTGVALTRLAAHSLGHAHALDPGAVAGLVLRALAHLNDLPQPNSSEQVRACWARAGIRTDTLSSRVLTYGFQPIGDDLVSTMLALSTRQSAPLVLTLQQVEQHARSGAPLVQSGTMVSICENVTVVAEAAYQLGRSCRPVVCVEGRPSLAAVRILQHLHRTGAALRYHGDFDWDGLAIADQVIRLGASPWRMSAHDYQEAARLYPDTAVLALTDAPICDYDWAPGLITNMRQTRRQIEEEQLLDVLLVDLHH